MYCEISVGDKCTKNATWIHRTGKRYCNFHKAFLVSDSYTHGSNIYIDQDFERIKSLKNSTDSLLKQRGSIYGDIRDNMNCAKELLDILGRYDLHLSELINNKYDEVAHQGCLIMIVHKLARIVTGTAIHADNYDDIGGYAKLARDIALKSQEAKSAKYSTDNVPKDVSVPNEAPQPRDKYPRNPIKPPGGGYSE